MKRINYYKKPALYQEAGVREYWIVDPAREIIVFFDFPNETPPTIYRFTDSVKVSIYKDFSIDFSQLNL
ncbi:Uma2 family endonuclease [Enterocloster clostridioformis]|nr:Uma2 family endonuclease [Enterocloster clostridioformis]